MSFPFECPERSEDVERTIFVTQFPPRLFASSGLSGYLGNRCAVRNEAAHFASEAFEVAALVGNGASPFVDHRAVPGNNALGLDAPQTIEVGEEAANTAIK